MPDQFFSKEELEAYREKFYNALDNCDNHKLCKKESKNIKEIEKLQEKNY